MAAFQNHQKRKENQDSSRETIRRQRFIPFTSFSLGYLFWLLRVSYEKVFTTEAPSSQSSANFLIKKVLLRVLRVSAVQSPSLFHRKPEDP